MENSGQPDGDAAQRRQEAAMLKRDDTLSTIFSFLGACCWIFAPCFFMYRCLQYRDIEKFTGADGMVVAYVLAAGLVCFAIGSVLRCLWFICLELVRQRAAEAARLPKPSPATSGRTGITPEIWGGGPPESKPSTPP